MHFEISNEVMKQWDQDGTLLSTPAVPIGSVPKAAPAPIAVPVSPPTTPVDPNGCQNKAWPIYDYETPIVYQSDVVVIQHLLNHVGNNLTADGLFGQKTANAVESFQESAGLARTHLLSTIFLSDQECSFG